MKLLTKIGTIVAAASLVIAVPASAWQSHSGGKDPSHQGVGARQALRGHHGFRGHHGRRHGHFLVSSGKLATWDATQTGTGTYSGTITLDVVKCHGKVKGRRQAFATIATPTQVTYTLSNTKVVFGSGANPPAAGDRVAVIGTATWTSGSTTPTITVKKVFVGVRHTRTAPTPGSWQGNS
jgi:hypothetical protein